MNIATSISNDFFGGEDLHQFSFFRKPIQNTEPLRAITLPDIYRYIVGKYAKPQTEMLRSIKDKDEARRYKATHFDYCTFSGIFRSRNRKDLLTQSNLLCIDFDHVADIPSLKERLPCDPCFETELLFVSPSGDGLKWIVEIDYQGYEHSGFFACVANYLAEKGYPEPDKSGSDISRSCFIPYDPDAFINPKYGIHRYENFFSTDVRPCPF